MTKDELQLIGKMKSSAHWFSFPAPIGLPIKEPADSMVAAILVSTQFLLPYMHIAKIEGKRFGELLFNAAKDPVLIEGVINNVFTSLQHHFISNYQGRNFLFFTHRNIQRKLVAEPGSIAVFIYWLKINQLLYPAFFNTETIGNNNLIDDTV